jgi:protein Tob/BTG
MLKEIKSAVQLLVHILSLNNAITKSKLEKFSECLEKLLCLRYEEHWHPTKPFRGSAYRCIRITHKIMDTVIEKAAEKSGLSIDDLYKSLPQDFTLWIDPADVSYRIGEDGSICCLFSTNTEEAPTISNVSQSCQAEVPTPIHNGSTLTKCLS